MACHTIPVRTFQCTFYRVVLEKINKFIVENEY